jgi:hypothetical protein
MKDELTTDMQFEFMEGEVSKFDFYIFSISGAIARGISKEEACKQHGISVEEYDANIDRVLNDPSW